MERNDEKYSSTISKFSLYFEMKNILKLPAISACIKCGEELKKFIAKNKYTDIDDDDASQIIILPDKLL